MIDKDKIIRTETSKFKKLFSGIPEDKKMFAERLYKQAAFMLATLQELQETVNEKGAVIEGVNGNGFKVVSENPAQKSYNIMIKNYNATVKLLIEMLPEGEKGTDELMDFIGGKP